MSMSDVVSEPRDTVRRFYALALVDVADVIATDGLSGAAQFIVDYIMDHGEGPPKESEARIVRRMLDSLAR